MNNNRVRTAGAPGGGFRSPEYLILGLQKVNIL